MTKWHDDAVSGLARAIDEAKARGHALVEPEHVLWADVQAGSLVAGVAERSGVPLAKVKAALDARMPPRNRDGVRVQPRYSDRLRECIRAARAAAAAGDGEPLGWDPLVAAVLSAEGDELGLDARHVAALAQALRQLEDAGVPAVPAPPDVLASYCLDLTARAAEGKLAPVVGRDDEVRKVVTVLAQKVTNNPLLVGEPGVGKTAIVEGVARQINAGAAGLLRGKRLLSLDLGGLLAGATYRGEFEERLKKVIEAVAAARGQVILFVDEIHTLMGAGRAGGGPDAANLLKPALARGELWLIGATTYAEYHQHVAADEAFARRFQRLDVGEPSPEEALTILRGVHDGFAAHHGVTYPDDVLALMVQLARRYLGGLQFPDKAIKVLDRSGARVAVARAAGEKRPAGVTADDVRDVVADMAGLPPERLRLDDDGQAERVSALLRERLVGQDKAVARLAERLRVALSPLHGPGRPRAVLVFTGPPGVGKTYCARLLARELYAGDKHLVDIDMSALSESNSTHRLVGAPPGYVGYEEGGQLTEAVWRRPYSLVLLDNFERAHPAVRKLVAQAATEGRLTDGKGRTVSFAACLFVMTTQAPERALPADLRGAADEVIPFETLGPEHVDRLADLYLAEVALRVGEAAGGGPAASLALTRAARAALAAEAFDPEAGARGVRSYLERAVVGGLVQAFRDPSALAGKKIVVDHDGGQYTFSCKPPRRPKK